jgi:hypothetical protein
VVLVSVVLLTIGAGAVLGGWVLSSRQDRIIGCVTGYSNALAVALDKRAAASEAARRELDEVMTTVADAFEDASPAAGDRVRSAIRTYVERRQDTRETQAENPLPQPPRDVCADLVK